MARALVAVAATAALALGAGLIWQRRLGPVVVSVGVHVPPLDGAVIDPSDRNSAEFFLENHPRSRIRLIHHFNPPDAVAASASLAVQKRSGVQLFVSTQASNQALPSLPLFRDGQALAVNVSAVSNALSGRDDFFVRIVPDLRAEQRAIARAFDRVPGTRLLVLQDTGNRAYTDPAFAVFAAELRRGGRWRLERRDLAIRRFDAARDRPLLEGDFDALYVLGGSFQPMIGNLSQLFHQLHPRATIVLTPWARSPLVTASAGPAAEHILLVSPYPTRYKNGQVDAFLRRFEQRFGYTPYAMAFGTYQALELIDQALASGATSPIEVKRFLLERPEHSTSFGPVRFDASGDVMAPYHVFPLAADQSRIPR
jgi:branched-chain amino acid transport system substrate-binding protein